MGGAFAGRTEVVGGADQPGTEQPVPDAIGHDPGGQRVVAAGQPAGQFTTAAFVGREERGLAQRCHLEETPRHPRALVLDAAPDVDTGILDLFLLGHGHDHVASGPLTRSSFQLGLLLAQQQDIRACRQVLAGSRLLTRDGGLEAGDLLLEGGDGGLVPAKNVFLFGARGQREFQPLRDVGVLQCAGIAKDASQGVVVQSPLWGRTCGRGSDAGRRSGPGRRGK